MWKQESWTWESVGSILYVKVQFSLKNKKTSKEPSFYEWVEQKKEKRISTLKIKWIKLN